MAQPKPLFLLDECISSEKNYHASKKFLRTVDVLGRGTKDPEILEYVKNKRLVIVTRDRGLMIESLLMGKPVVLVRKNPNQTFLIKAKIEHNPGFSNPVTYELWENDEVIWP